MKKASFKTVLKKMLDCGRMKNESRAHFLERRRKERKKARYELRKDHRNAGLGPLKRGRPLWKGTP